jgi:hypothetical protein
LDNLTAHYTYYDFDGDPEGDSEIRWYKNGGLQPTYNDQLTVPGSATAIGEEWHFTVKPNDGTQFGELEASSSVEVRQPPRPTKLKFRKE